MSAGVVIIGGGQAGAQVAQSLREGGYPDPVVIVGEEAISPYQRPPLSKAYLAGEADRESLVLRDDSYYEAQDITVITGDRVETVTLDPGEGGRATTASGADLPFAHLVLATGAAPRSLTLPGFSGDAVHVLRDLEDADRLAEGLASAQRVVVVGGGFIGLEAAAVARARGCAVTVLEAAPRLLGRAAPPEISTFVQQHHQARGIEFHLDARITGLRQADGGLDVVLEDGASLPADLVVVGVGAAPRTELAEAIGAEVDQGIVVDEFARTTLPGVYAAGDCTNGGHVEFVGRMESVQNAIDQAKTVAASILGQQQPYATVPFFWSDQADLHLQMAGIVGPGDDCVVREGADDLAVLAFREDGSFRGVATVNRPRDFMVGRRALHHGQQLDRTRLADPEVSMRDLLLG
jgi:3-phenylpropionate/trans-cinnamate dioxygenase ferredoxin reductase component